MIKTKHHHYILGIVIVIVAVSFLAFSAYWVRMGPGSTKSKATQDTFLTPGNDALSLQQDLQNLGTDPGASIENEVNTVQ